MKNKLTLLSCVLMLSCKSIEDKAYDMTYKAHSKSRIGTMRASSELFPTKDSVYTHTEYIKGDPIPVPGPTVTLDCDSLREATNGKEAVFTHTCPSCDKQVDTFRVTTSKTIVDNKMLELARDSLEVAHDNYSILLSRNKKSVRYNYILGAICIVLGLLSYLLFKIRGK